MGKDIRETNDNKFPSGKGKPSGINKSEPEIPADLPVRHPNRNVDKGNSNGVVHSQQNKSRTAQSAEAMATTEQVELHGILTKEIFNELASFDQAPCISILLPTHRAGVEVNEQLDMKTFKAALQQAEKTLKERAIPQDTIKRILLPGHELLNNAEFWYAQSDGLAVYMADGFFRYIQLRAPLIQQVYVNSSFYVSPLVPFMVRTEYFYLLNLAKKHPHLYRVDAMGIETLHIDEMPTGIDDVVRLENKTDDKLIRAGSGTKGGNYHGMGAGRPDDVENMRLYFEEVDDTIWQSHMHREHVPLVLAGQDHLIPIYRSVSDYSNVWPEALTGNHHQQSDKELFAAAMELMKPYFERPLQRALDDYGNKRATALTSSMIETVIPAAYYGRISHLFVTKGASISGVFNEQENKLQTMDREDEHAEDLVDKAVIKTIQNGGEVYLLDADKMPEQSEVVAILRY